MDGKGKHAALVVVSHTQREPETGRCAPEVLGSVRLQKHEPPFDIPVRGANEPSDPTSDK